MADVDPDFHTAVLVPSQQELRLQTVPLAVAAFPSRAGNQVMRALGAVAPLTDLKHLKRVRKAPDDASLLEAILCVLDCSYGASDVVVGSAEGSAPAAEDSQSPDLAPECLAAPLQALYAQHTGVRLRLIHGTAQPPQTRQQWEAWTKLWPVTWRIPEHGTPVTEETPVDAKTQLYFEHQMRAALRLAQQAGVDNAAVIAEPPSLTPVAEAADGSAAHPLRHSVMAVIQAASNRDLALWPPSASVDACNNGDGPGGASTCDPCSEGDAAERRAASEPGSCTSTGAEPQGQSRQPNGPTGRRSDAGGCAGEGDEAGGEELASKRPRLGVGPQGVQAPVTGSRPYMCTGYDCFVVREPCIMCGMALVHSRVQRVIYCQPDPALGALGGCRRLHACKSLNHNYEVFRMELKRQ